MKKWIIVISIAVVIATITFVLAPSFFQFNLNQITQTKLTNGESIKNVAIKTINSPYIKEYALPNGTFPNGILVDNNGMVWIASSTSILFKFDPDIGAIKSSYRISEKNLPNEQSNRSFMVWSIVQDNDGLIWFSQTSPDPVWQFNPKTEKFTAFHSSAAPFQMKIDRKTGNIWFTTLTANTIGVIQKTGLPDSPYKITEFDAGQNTYPSGLFLDENHLLVTEIQSQKLVKFDIIKNEDGIVIGLNKTLDLPNDGRNSILSPTDVIDSGDMLWITEHGTSFLTNYDVDNQKLQRFPTALNPQNSTTLPFWLKEDPNAQGIWFNEHTGSRIGFFDAKNMALIEYEIPSRPPDGYIVYPLNLAIDPQNSDKVWFSEWNTDKIGMIDRRIPIPFGLEVDDRQITLSNDSPDAIVNFEITKNDLSNNNTLSLKPTSSMDFTSRLENMTAEFSRQNLTISEMSQTEKMTLDLHANNAPSGNYTLGISVTDGIVTRSDYADLIIK